VRSLDSISHEAYRKGKGEGFKEAVLILCEFCANGRSAEHVKESGEWIHKSATNKKIPCRASHVRKIAEKAGFNTKYWHRENDIKKVK